MAKPEFTVIGDWAIRNSNGYLSHRPCRRACIAYNTGKSYFHVCSSEELDLEDKDRYVNPLEYGGSGYRIEIPEFVQLIARTMRGR